MVPGTSTRVAVLYGGYWEERDVSMLFLLPDMETGTVGEALVMSALYLVGAAMAPMWLADRSRAKWIASGGGVFEVAVDGKLIFSKKALDRFPDEGEVAAEISRLIDQSMALERCLCGGSLASSLVSRNAEICHCLT